MARSTPTRKPGPDAPPRRRMRGFEPAATLVAVDIALLLGVWVGVRRVSDRVSELFARMGEPSTAKKVA